MSSGRSSIAFLPSCLLDVAALYQHGRNLSGHQLIMLIVTYWHQLSVVDCINTPGCELGQLESRSTLPSVNAVIGAVISKRGAK